MLKFKLFLATLLFFLNVIAQSKLTNKADAFYAAKNYFAAAKFYLLSAKEDEFKVLKSGDYYNAACCYSLAGKLDSAMVLLNLSISNGYKNIAHLKVDSDLDTLHSNPGWTTLINSMDETATSTIDPTQVKLITTDIDNFWKAYDTAQKNKRHRLDIYRKYYLDAGTAGLQDYFAYKIKSLKNFVAGHDDKEKFYAAIRNNTYTVNGQKKEMINSFIKLKNIYPAANFPDIYFVIGSFSSAGTSTDNGLLIGLDQAVKTPDIPTEELTLWQRNNFSNLSELPYLVAHELIHFNQQGINGDTTLLHGVLIEGMADFIGELISGSNPNKRLHIWAKGKEKQVWADFEKEMYLKRNYNWIANSNQETADKPADLGYWVGYQICKAYYDNSIDKTLAIKNMLNIKNCNDFYIKSGVEHLFK